MTGRQVSKPARKTNSSSRKLENTNEGHLPARRGHVKQLEAVLIQPLNGLSGLRCANALSAVMELHQHLIDCQAGRKEIVDHFVLGALDINHQQIDSGVAE